MTFTILFLSIIILILAMIIKKYKSREVVNNYLYKSLLSSYQILNDEKKKILEEQEANLITITNLENSIKFPIQNEYIRYSNITVIEDQKIVIIIDVENEFSQEMQIIRKEMGLKEIAKSCRTIECWAFIDGKLVDPLLVERIFKDRRTIEIKDINCKKYKGKGLGTEVLKFLFEILVSLGIEEVYAKLSPVDFEVRDKLYNFYINKNGFELDKELTSDSWGLVRKKIVTKKF